MQNERIDQLYSQNVKIIQSPDVFSFSLDAVLLADFAKVVTSPKGKIVDLCAGNGAVGLFISRKTKAHIDMIEIQPRLADMAQRSVALNHLENQITVHTMDIADAFKVIAKDSIDSITCNPPYFANLDTSKKNPNPYLAIARHEIKTNFDTVARIASGLLKYNGKLFLVHRPDRLTELLMTLSKYQLTPKVLRFILPRQDKEANMVLIEAIKAGKLGGLRVLPELVVYNGKNYTSEVQHLLGKQ